MPSTLALESGKAGYPPWRHLAFLHGLVKEKSVPWMVKMLFGFTARVDKRMIDSNIL